MKIKYITTAIDYPNSLPHIGHAYEKILADFYNRYYKQKGENTFYQTGTDEHGIKIYNTAKNNKVTPKKLVDSNSKKFKEFYKKLNIEYDNFVRTSDKKNHWPGVQNLWNELIKSGDLFLKKYNAKYCIGCESFKTDSELIDGFCEYHPNKKLENVEEENYFFKLSKYQKKLIDIISKEKYKVQPKSVKNELISFLKEDLQDISFSRVKSKLPWGIPVPNDKNQVMYVWADALSNYITGIGYGSNKKNYEKLWPADAHIIGKDISRFHAIYWPAMLLSAKLKLPKKLLAHGFVNDKDGKKMSKSLGNVVDPIEQVNKYGASSLRYYLLRSPSNQDVSYDESDLITKHNTELSNNLGNLVSRSLNLIEKSGGKIPSGKLDKKIESNYKKLLKNIDKNIEDFEFHMAVSNIWNFISSINEYIDMKKPWTLSGKEKENILYNLAESLKLICALIYPIIPSKSLEISKKLGLKNVPKFKSDKIKIGQKINKGEYLFTKYEN